MSKTNPKALKTQFRRQFTPYQPKPYWFKATVGDGDGNIEVPDKPGYIYVTDLTDVVHKAFNRAAPVDREGILVAVGYDPQDPSRLAVLWLINPWVQESLPGLPGHHRTHEWLGSDQVTISAMQFLPGLVRTLTGTSMVVGIWPFPLKLADGTAKRIPYREVNLTSNIPVSGARWVLITFSLTTGATVLQNGSTVASISILGATDIPAADDGYITLAAVSCYAGQTAVVQNATRNDIVDLRFGPGGGGGGSASNFTDLLDVPSSYTGYAGKVVAVNATEDGLEFGLPDAVEIVAEDWSSQVDGLTAHFTTAETFIAGSLLVVINGLEQNKTTTCMEDVTLDGFTLDFIPPSGSQVFGLYWKQVALITTVVSVNGDVGVVTVKRQVTFALEGTLTSAANHGTIRIPNQTTHPLTIQGVYLNADTGPTGQDLIADIHMDGTTIFTNQAHRPRILDGANDGNSTDIDVSAWAVGSYLTMDVDQFGSTLAGGNLTVTVECAG